jgi:hypothetical protein
MGVCVSRCVSVSRCVCVSVCVCVGVCVHARDDTGCTCMRRLWVCMHSGVCCNLKAVSIDTLRNNHCDMTRMCVQSMQAYVRNRCLHVCVIDAGMFVQLKVSHTIDSP